MRFVLIVVLTLGMFAGVAKANEDATANEYVLTIKDYKFTPEELKVPAGQKIKLVVDNQDSSAEEFESHDMNVEKIIYPNSKGIVTVGPLKPGKYNYFGEFNMDTAKGVIIAE